VDEIPIFYDGTRRDVMMSKEILDLYCAIKGMLVNDEKSCISYIGVLDDEHAYFSTFFPYVNTNLDDGMKYLGFMLKPNDYLKKD
jgi:hypothetical protein